MKYVDVHFHWADPRFSQDFESLKSRLQSCFTKNIDFFLQAGVDPADWERQKSLKNHFPANFGLCFGLHPYFPRTADVRLSAQVGGVWRNTPDMLPVEHTPVPPELDFSKGPAVSGITVDNCFTGWDGKALIEWPSRHRGLSIEATPEFRNLVVFVPPKQDFFCVEPVTNVNDGFNKLARKEENTGVVVLQPGETLAGTVRFRVTKA